MSEKMEFQTEVSRLLDIVANALYTEKEIFLRELVSNASDACDRLRYEAIAKPELLSGDADFKIRLWFDTDARTLTIADNGIGMDKAALIKNLGTIAHSGTRELVQNLEGGAKKDVNLIGQFGVGFYSAFMVADRVDVTSRRAGDATAWVWSSDGRGSYTIDEALKDTRGTEIVLHIKDDASEFLIEERLKTVVKKYSDHIAFPILLGPGDKGVMVNAASALWMRPKADVTPEQYKEFYRSVSGALQMDEPWLTVHWRAEGAIEYSNLLMIPSMKPFDLYDPRRHHGVKLYVKRVFITEGVEGLIPPFLRFVKGVVDSEDLPLNISREMLQANPVIAKMSSAVTKKILSELEQKAKDDIKEFENFWALFGPVVKEGLYDAHNHREQLCRVARFYSTHGDGLTSLEEYVSRMVEGQEHIYYLSAPSVEAAKNSPQLEAFRARGVEVLFMTDAIDEFWLPMQNDFKQKKFKSVTRGDAELSKIKKLDGDDKADDKAEDKNATENLLARMKEILSLEVKDVQLSERLVDSPVCLVAPESDVDINMQRLLKKNQGYEGMHQHILEINVKHPVIAKLQLLAANDAEASKELLRETTLLLLDQARIIEGEPLKNPGEFVRRLSRAIEKGLIAG
ncbi:MAG TPA: molecular chaperone HtpG [Alphaproteobacteria bacterium]|nr:molecular chaperone HtpG [Rhodospirillaceae bacterium]HRJ66547.1 molecular chaperone HtpG [Alphaproteobacteria bacterium]